MGRAEEIRLFIEDSSLLHSRFLGSPRNAENGCVADYEDSHTNNSSLQSEGRRFLRETKSYIDRPSTSPLKPVFDSPQLSGSIKVQDGGDNIISEKIKDSAAKYACFSG